jgi:hypothetical protein
VALDSAGDSPPEPRVSLHTRVNWWICVFGLTLFYLGAGALVLGFLPLDPPRFKLLNGVAFLGSYSYSTYLWHLPMISWETSALSKLFIELSYPWYFIISLFRIIYLRDSPIQVNRISDSPLAQSSFSLEKSPLNGT